MLLGRFAPSASKTARHIQSRKKAGGARAKGTTAPKQKSEKERGSQVKEEKKLAWDPKKLAKLVKAPGPIAESIFGVVRSGRTVLACVVPTPDIAESMESHHKPACALRGHICIAHEIISSHVIKLLKSNSFLVFIPPAHADELADKMERLDNDRRVSWFANVIWNGYPKPGEIDQAERVES